ncbi:amino acid adenylation domain-containing protein [Kosakonia pseudosacchari]|uniref:non-ribosomal peptide synthetase n=1 Tax=Kosakonia pseudosacchari TaxID=1646340 RepID=UPI0022F1132A|nr:non-ribosomal peptide synthetase [Kosakonia pseudosacchari]WBU50059.1 amino acid adenylation domain-containing protein [Kosakonia pseudosacchari]
MDISPNNSFLDSASVAKECTALPASPFPLSSDQQAIWFAQTLNPELTNYNIGSVMIIDGNIVPDIMIKAFDSVIKRHDAFRLRIVAGTSPAQYFASSALPLMEFKDFSATDNPINEAEQYVKLNFTQPFNLAERLWRSSLIYAGNNRWYWQLCCHHIIADGTSLSLLNVELSEKYSRLIRGEKLSAGAALSYADFVASDAAYLSAKQCSKDQAFWLERYTTLPPPLFPPLATTRTPASYLPDPVTWMLEENLFQRIEQVASLYGLSILHFMYALFACYFKRIKNSDDIVFGIPLHNRRNAQQKTAVGMYASVIPVRIRLIDEDTFSDVMQKAADELRFCYKHQRLPITEIQRRIKNQQKTDSANLFDMSLSYEPYDVNIHLEGASVHTIKPHHRAQYPLAITINQYAITSNNKQSQSVCVEFNFSLDYFTPADIQVMQSRLAVLLEGVLQNSDTPVSHLPILSTHERQKLLQPAPAIESDASDLLIHEMFEAQVRRSPQAIAVVFEGESLTYDALNRRANTLAHQLIRMGVHPNDRVAICLQRGLDMVIGILGILKAGGGYVPLDPVYPGERLNYMLEDSAPVALVTHSGLVQALNSAIPAVLMDAPFPASADEDDENNPVPLSPGLAAHHLAYVIYTSGSTGQPKGVMVEHRNITRLLTVSQPVFSFSRNDTWSLCHSFAFDFSVWELFGALCSGGRLIVVSTACARSPDALYAVLCREQVTVLNQTPSAFRQLIAALDSTPHTLRCIIFGGEALEMRTLVPWIHNAANRNTRLINMYGITEITVHATWYEIAPSDITSQGASVIGGPLADLRIYILDNHRQLVPSGVTGELYIAGNGVARGYLNRPDQTAERFLPDPFTPGQRMYRTGDLGRWLPDGNIEFLGRNDFQVKLRGFRIEPGEIEACLAGCDGVRDAVVMVREDTPGDKRLVAYLLAQPGQTPSPARLRQQLAQSLAEYMLPAAFVTLESFPLTPNGKLDRRALPAPDRTAVVTRGDDAPVGEVENALAAIWCDLLGLSLVGRHDNFFELGGHSLRVVSLLERLRGRGMTLDIRGAFSAPVLADMAQRITLREADTPVPPPRIPADCRAITPGMLPLVSLSQAETDAVVATVEGGAANVQDIYPLSPLQEGILFHHLLQGQGDAYLLSSLLAFDTRALLEAFLAALQQVIDRHDILRSAVCWQGVSRPVQVVRRRAVLPVTVLVPQAGQDVTAQLRAQASRPRRMDVSRAPLFRAQTAYDPAQPRWLLALEFHHLVCDHISMALVCDEITQILDGNAAALAAPVPYRNFIARTLRVPESEHEAWFRARLADIDTPTAPYDTAVTRESDGTGGEARQTLDSALAGHIRAQARRLGVSPGVLFHTALARLLAQLCGRDEVVSGTVLMGRLQAGDSGESGPGMFINTLPLRVSLAGLSAQEAVLATRDALAALFEHEQAPLSLALRCSGVPQPLPLFSTLLNYRHSPARSGLIREGIRLLEAQERTHYPIVFSVDDTGEGFILTAQTAAGIDPQRQAGYLQATLASLSAALAHEPQRPVLSLPVLPEGERNQMLVTFNATRAALPAERLVHRLFEAQVARTPDAVAVVCEDITLSYAALNRRANRLAHRLLAQGVRPDDRVAVCLPRSADALVAILGILKAGGAYVPLDPAYPAGRLDYMLADAAPVALVTQRALAQKPDTALPVILTDAEPEEGAAEHNPEAQGLTPAHLAYVIYTSGSTGKPRGVMVEHRNVINLYAALQFRLDLQQPSRITMNASMVFDASVQCWLQLLSGHTVVIVPEAVRKEGTAFLDFLRRQRIDIVDCTPLQLQGLLDAGLHDIAKEHPSMVIIGGDAIPLSAWSAMQNIEQIHFVNAYGPTECTVNASMCMIDKTLATPSIGKPLANTQIYLLDEHGLPVPLGICGEIHIAGESVARGYLNHPELTAERFLPDPFTPGQRMYRTGDLGRWLPDGNIEFLGRNDFQVKLRGFRIEPGEIEACLAECDGVRDAVVMVREDTPGDKRLVAYLLAQPGHTPEPAQLRQQLAQSLAEYMLPAAFVTLESFPLTPNGKLDRRALPVPDRTAVVTRGDDAPVGDVEETLAAIWCDLLGLSQVGRHDNFFELGGHSLLAVQLLNRMAKTGLPISLATLFARPSLAQLACVIQNRETSLVSPFADNPIVLRDEGAQPPLFLLHEPSGDPLVYSPLATLLRIDRPVYALSALGLHTAENPPTSLEALAACHIEAIRRVQPHGPYHLAGWSLGGVISYEIAVQLQRSGEEIAFIGMIDSYHPAAHQTRDFSTSSERALRDDMIVNFLSMHVPESERSILAQLQTPIDMQAVFDLCSEHNWLPKDIRYEDLLLRMETVLYLRPLGLRYQPTSADLSINLYTANPDESDDIWRGWHGTVSSDSSLHIVGGTHLSIMQPPLLAQLAKRMSADLLPRSCWHPVVVMQEGADCETPLFCIPGAGASAFSFLDLVGFLPAKLPVYALQARGLTNVKTMPHLTIEETARDYICAIRERQPSGPYHLIGHSFGGWIAFEIALQLQAQGEMVADLIIIDSRSPGVRPPISHLGAVMQLISIYNLMLNRALPVTEEALSRMEPHQRLICLHQLLIEAGVYTHNTPLSLLAGVFHVLYANLNTSYIPRKRYQGMLHSINAQEANGAERAQREAIWREYATHFTTVLSPGNHMTMLTAPHAGVLADHIMTVMSKP